MPGHSSLLGADYVNLSALPGIHVFLGCHLDVDGQDEPGHDGRVFLTLSSRIPKKPLPTAFSKESRCPLPPSNPPSTPRSTPGTASPARPRARSATLSIMRSTCSTRARRAWLSARQAANGKCISG